MTHIDTDAVAFQTMPKPPRIAPRKRARQLSRFEIWAWSPVISFQVGLTAGYFALIYFGVAAMFASPPSITMTTPDGYEGFWAAALAGGAALSALGSVAQRSKVFQRIETVGASLLSLTVGSYASIMTWLAYADGEYDRIAASAGFVALTIPIIIRTMWLYSQLLRK